MNTSENNTNPEKNQDQEKITITVKEYAYLLDRDDFLTCLEGWGVDNWSGYDEAQQDYLEGKE